MESLESVNLVFINQIYHIADALAQNMERIKKICEQAIKYELNKTYPKLFK